MAPLLLVLLLLLPGAAAAQAPLPTPTYANTLYLYFDTPGFMGTDADFTTSADTLQAIGPGPYARVGMYTYVVPDAAWPGPDEPLGLSPSVASLDAALARARTRSLTAHLAFCAGISRVTGIYSSALAEDRRNAQWYSDGTLSKVGYSSGGDVYVTPSRYARRVRRHLEGKIRATALALVDLRKRYPETLTSASGDGEMELNTGGGDILKPYQEQILADYSPFAMAEFRDWVKHEGLYATGGAFEGEGYSGGGAPYQGAGGLAAFNSAFGTAFASWRLRYFDWDLSDAVDGDPKALGPERVADPSFSPLPVSGPDFVEGGFDAPRSWAVPTSAFWDLWLLFRQEMVHNYTTDFARWMTTTAAPDGTTWPADRWYTHQIPGDYLYGTYPGCPNPDRRLLTSASSVKTGIVGKYGSLGLTVFDVVMSSGYQRTSQYLFDALSAMKLPNWGIVEYSPMWPIESIDNDATTIAWNIRRAWAAGAHVLAHQPWSVLVGTATQEGFRRFAVEAAWKPRDAVGATTAAPPRVNMLKGSRTAAGIQLSWSPKLYADGSPYRFADWPGFGQFEVYRMSNPTYEPTLSDRVGTASGATLTDPLPDASKPYYRVLAVGRTGIRGEASEAWAGGLFTISPCRVLDTRNATGGDAAAPILAAGSVRTFPLASQRCGVPTNAIAVSANVTVTDGSVVGVLRIVAGNVAFTDATSVSFVPAKARANNALLGLADDGLGTIAVKNDSPGDIHLIVDVNGYFQ